MKRCPTCGSRFCTTAAADELRFEKLLAEDFGAMLEDIRRPGHSALRWNSELQRIDVFDPHP